MSNVSDSQFVIAFFSGCVVTVLIFLFYYLLDKLEDTVIEHNQKKKYNYKQQLFYFGSRDENYFRRFVELENRSIRVEIMLNEIIDYINDNESSVKDDE